VGKKVVPLRALVDFELWESSKTLARINGENSFRLEGFLTEKEKKHSNVVLAKIKKFTKNFTTNILPTISNKVTVNMVDAKIELTKAIHELILTTLLSLVLIFLVLYLRFSSVIHTLIIMLAIPFGMLGVFLSLWIFNSTLSLNSALGIILLNGITVANSIMLVDRILKNISKGIEAKQAILLTAKERIRPILMTSIITILGMLPIAFGFGEGGKVLQPLGIAVSGGLWVSLIFTLYIIPALEYKVLTYAKS
jgi:HAE1 family hydrophobic/amphiphilic exporter-1